MSLFKPSHLSPNFEEVVYDQPLIISFQVNSNSSTVTAYKLEILHEYNDLYEPEKNIIGTIYGLFQQPLHNKDMAQILLTQDMLCLNGITLEPNKDYKWRIRLYGEKQWQEYESGLMIVGDAPQDGTKVTNFNVYSNVFRTGINQSGKSYFISKTHDDTLSNNVYLLLSHKPIDYNYLIFNIYSQYESMTIDDLKSYLLQQYNTLLISDDLSYTQCNHIVSPNMYFNWIYIETTESVVTDIRLALSDDISNNNAYTISIHYILDTIDKNTTYIGSGMVTGSTKQVIWTQSYHSKLARNQYARIIWQSGGSAAFSPYEGDVAFIPIDIENDVVNETYSSYVIIPRGAIKKEYFANLSQGHMYGMIYFSTENLSSVSVKQLKKIINVEQNREDLSKINLHTLPNYPFLMSPTGAMNTGSTAYLVLYWVQQEKIIQVDKNVGDHNLVKTTFEKPFEYNPIDGQDLRLGYVSEDFDSDRIYIEPIAEFDNSDSFSYIKIVPHTGLLETSQQINATTVESNQYFHKIINYVGTTGEVTLYNSMDYIPSIQFLYQIYKRNASDNTKYDLVGGSWGTNYCYLGGQQNDYLDIFTNHYVRAQSSNGENVYFDYLFVQPNIAIKDDPFYPMSLEVYNNDHKAVVHITDLWRSNNGVSEGEAQIPTINAIDKLDNSMWLVVVKNFTGDYNGLSSDYGDDQENVVIIDDSRKNLILPQTAYKIYTNFVDSTPEGYFYCRYNKHIGFNVCNLNNVEDTIYIEGNDLHDNAIDFRDLFIKCSCQDIDEQGTLLGVNNVPIKEYRYEIMSADNEVIYDSGELYDGKLECQFRGCINNTVYHIKIYIEDNYGKLFTSRIKIHVNYVEVIDKNNITITSVCEKQAIHLDFSPIKQFQANGNIVGTTGVAVQIGEGGLTFDRIEDHTLNTVELPNTFSFIFTFSLNANIVLDQNIHLINQVVTDETTNSLQDTYSIYLDTRPYLLDNGVYSINERYMQLLVFKNDTYDADNPCCVYDLLTNEFKQTLQFAYILQKDSAVPHNNYIYIAPSNIQEVSESDRAMFMNTIPSSCVDEAGVLTMFRDDGSTTEDDVFLISDVLNNGDYFINKYQVYLSNMSRINCVIKNISDNETPNVSFTIGEAL